MVIHSSYDRSGHAVEKQEISELIKDWGIPMPIYQVSGDERASAESVVFSAGPGPRNGLRVSPSGFTADNHKGLTVEVSLHEIGSCVMASEAKIGLLLGLVIIFVIAFVLNELPRFGDVADSEPSGVSAADRAPGIGALARDHINTNRTVEPTVRSADPLPSDPDNEQSEIVHAPLPASPPVDPEGSTEQAPAVEQARQALATVYYTVAEGDNLADIAKKFYGTIEGNRKINVFRIFEANRQLLESPHEIIVGQRLVIPPLRASEPGGVEIASIFPSSMFEKVKSIGMRHFSADNRTPVKSRRYVVREGDNLWRVAAAQLGDGSRYREISRLNSHVLEDEDRLTVGMQLNLPAQ